MTYRLRKAERVVRQRLIADPIIVSYDVGSEKGDYSAMIVARTPGKLRKLLRRIGLDKSTWIYKVVDQAIIETGERID